MRIINATSTRDELYVLLMEHEGRPAASDVWLENFSLSAYGPMLRLAQTGDRAFLRSFAERRERRRYRRVYRRFLRQYLHSLSADFHRLHAIAVAKTRQTTAGRRVSMGLYEQQMAFIFQVWSVEARLLLHCIIPHAIDLRPLLNGVEALANETRDAVRPRVHYRSM